MRKTLIKRKKSRKSKNKRNRRTRKMVKRGGGKWDDYKPPSAKAPYSRSVASGSDLRNQLVTLCRQGKFEDYDKVTQTIINNYRAETPNKDFFNHLSKQIQIGYKEDGVTPIIKSTTFSENTLLCLERTLTQLQEDGIPESMIYLHVISDLARQRNDASI